MSLLQSVDSEKSSNSKDLILPFKALATLPPRNPALSYIKEFVPSSELMLILDSIRQQGDVVKSSQPSLFKSPAHSHSINKMMIVFVNAFPTSVLKHVFFKQILIALILNESC